MKIKACTIKNLYGITDLGLSFVDPATGQIRSRTAIAGTNGSGKTTLLQVIGQMLGLVNALASDNAQKLTWVDFDGATLQLRISDLPPNNQNDLVIAVMPDSAKAQIAYIDGASPLDALREHSRIQASAVELAGQKAQLYQAIQNAEKGLIDFPNCIYFPAEERLLHKKPNAQISGSQKPYQWVYRFTDSDRWSDSLEEFLVQSYIRDLLAWHGEAKGGNGHQPSPQVQSGFTPLIEVINQFLINKQIQGVDQQTLRLKVQTSTKAHGLDDLSSGEKQIILLLGEIQRRIRQGSVVLIDEPELHLHPRWQRQLMAALTDLCARYDAQLIVTTHSEEIANSVYEHELVLLDDLFAVTQQAMLLPV